MDHEQDNELEQHQQRDQHDQRDPAHDYLDDPDHDLEDRIK